MTTSTSRRSCVTAERAALIPTFVLTPGRMSGQAHLRGCRMLGQEADDSGGRVVPDMTAEDLAEHLQMLGQATEEELDQLLHELLIRVYPSKQTQDS